MLSERFGDTNNQTVTTIAVDSAGNVGVAGTFLGSSIYQRQYARGEIIVVGHDGIARRLLCEDGAVIGVAAGSRVEFTRACALRRVIMPLLFVAMTRWTPVTLAGGSPNGYA